MVEGLENRLMHEAGLEPCKLATNFSEALVFAAKRTIGTLAAEKPANGRLFNAKILDRRKHFMAILLSCLPSFGLHPLARGFG